MFGATTAGEVQVRMTADGRPMLDSFKQAESAMTGLSGRLGRVMGTMGRVGAMAFTAIGTAGLAAVGTGLKVAADLEQTQVAFETLMGSGEKAQAFMEDLKDFAAKTPFEFPSLSEAAKKLMAVGTAADDVIPIMTTLGNATAAMGTGQEGIERATYALAQMQQKGKVSAEEMMQLAEAGVPAWDALAAVLGTTVPEAMKKVSAGTVAPAALFEALRTGAGKTLGELDGMMEKQSQTLSGLFSTLKDEVMMGLADAAKPLADALKPVIPKFAEQLGALLGTLASAFGPVLGEIVNIVAGLMPVLAPVMEVFGGALADALKALAPAIGPLAQAFGAIMVALAPILPVVADVIARVATLAATLISGLVPALSPIIEALLPEFVRLADELLPVFEPLVPMVVALAEGLSAVLVPLTPILPLLVQTVVVAKGLSVGLGLVKGAVTGVQTAMRLLATSNPLMLAFLAIIAVSLLVIKNWDKVKAFFAGLWDAIRGIGKAISDWLAQTVGGIADWVLDKWHGFLDFMSSLPGLLIAGVQAYVDFWLSIPGLILDAFKTIVNGIIGLWNNLDFGIHIEAPGWLGGWSFDVGDVFPDIPLLAKGGIVTRPTLAMVGEAGPEAVVPLNSAYGMGMREKAINLAVSVSMDRKRFTRDADFAARVRGV